MTLSDFKSDAWISLPCCRFCFCFCSMICRCWSNFCCRRLAEGNPSILKRTFPECVRDRPDRFRITFGTHLAPVKSAAVVVIVVQPCCLTPAPPALPPELDKRSGSQARPDILLLLLLLLPGSGAPIDRSFCNRKKGPDHRSPGLFDVAVSDAAASSGVVLVLCLI